MSNITEFNSDELLYNSIPNQNLTFANQLKIEDWNNIINVLRIQSNALTKNVKSMYPFIINNFAQISETLQNLKLQGVSVNGIKPDSDNNIDLIVMADKIPDTLVAGQYVYLTESTKTTTPLEVVSNEAETQSLVNDTPVTETLVNDNVVTTDTLVFNDNLSSYVTTDAESEVIDVTDAESDSNSILLDN